MKNKVVSTIDIASGNGYHKRVENTSGYLITVIGAGEDEVKAFNAANTPGECYQLLTASIVATIDTMYSHGASAGEITSLIEEAIDAAGKTFKKQVEERVHGNDLLLLH